MDTMLIFDMRHLYHPEPLEIMTKALPQANDGKILKMIHHREPIPLYELIQAGGLRYKTFKTSDEIYIIYIGRQERLESFLDSRDLRYLTSIPNHREYD